MCKTPKVRDAGAAQFSAYHRNRREYTKPAQVAGLELQIAGFGTTRQIRGFALFCDRCIRYSGYH